MAALMADAEESVSSILLREPAWCVEFEHLARRYSKCGPQQKTNSDARNWEAFYGILSFFFPTRMFFMCEDVTRVAGFMSEVPASHLNADGAWIHRDGHRLVIRQKSIDVCI